MSETLRSGVDLPADGRHRRRVENLEAVVTATLDLISETGALPTVAEVAHRAGISQRSVFRYFDDVDQLTRAAVDTRYRQATELIALPSPLPAALAERIDAVAASRRRLYEFIGPTARVTRTRLLDNPVLVETIGRSRRALREQLRAVFAPELGSGRDAAVILSALDVICSFESWDLLVRDQGLTPEEALVVLRESMTRLLSGWGTS